MPILAANIGVIIEAIELCFRNETNPITTKKKKKKKKKMKIKIPKNKKKKEIRNLYWNGAT